MQILILDGEAVEQQIRKLKVAYQFATDKEKEQLVVQLQVYENIQECMIVRIDRPDKPLEG